MDVQSGIPRRVHNPDKGFDSLGKRSRSTERQPFFWSGAVTNTQLQTLRKSAACPFSFLHCMFYPSSRAFVSHGDGETSFLERVPFGGSIVGILGFQDDTMGNSGTGTSDSITCLAKDSSVLLTEGDRKNEVTNSTCGNFEHPYFLKHQGEIDHHNCTTDEAPAALLSPHLQAVQVPSFTVKTRRGLEAVLQSARLEFDSEGAPSSAVLVPSTSGRVESEFWCERRKGRSHLVSQPTGRLYVVNPGTDKFAFSELEQGGKLEENVAIGEKHSVSTCFEQGNSGLDKSIWMSTSHKLDSNNILATHYANDLKGGADFTFNTSHFLVPDSRLSTSFHAASLGDPTLEVELEQEKDTKKVSESLMANLRTGDRVLRLQSKKTFKHNVLLSNSYMTNLRGQHSLRLEAAMPILGSGNISNNFTTNFRETHEVCLRAIQRIGDCNSFATSFITNLKQNNRICLEAKQVVRGTGEIALKLSNDLRGVTQLSLTSSHTHRRNRWGWTYRNDSGEGQSLGAEWRHEVASDNFFLVRASAKDWICNIYAELRVPV